MKKIKSKKEITSFESANERTTILRGSKKTTRPLTFLLSTDLIARSSRATWNVSLGLISSYRTRVRVFFSPSSENSVESKSLVKIKLGRRERERERLTTERRTLANRQTRWSTLKNYCGYDSFLLLLPEAELLSFFPRRWSINTANMEWPCPAKRKEQNIYQLLSSAFRFPFVYLPRTRRLVICRESGAFSSYSSST